MRPHFPLIRTARLVGALARSCHPLPTVAVTLFALVLAVVAGNPAGTCATLVVAVLAGQLSIGWSNDRRDAARDLAVGRPDKPLATGELARIHADRAIAGAIAVTIVCSLLLGWLPGLVHLGAVACGWVYNLWLKATPASWLPYAAAFAALPAVAVLARPNHPTPAAWAVAAGALLGITAHLTNALPDLVGDRLTGINGLPHRIGARRSLLVAAALLAGATTLVVFGPDGRVRPVGWAALAVAACALAGAAGFARRAPASRASFYGLVAVVAVDLAVIAVSGHHLR